MYKPNVGGAGFPDLGIGILKVQVIALKVQAKVMQSPFWKAFGFSQYVEIHVPEGLDVSSHLQRGRSKSLVVAESFSQVEGVDFLRCQLQLF